MLKDHATPEGTADYARRFVQYPVNYRPLLGLSISSVGIGTYLGNEDGATDAAYTQAIQAAVTGGVNLIDTAVNYRCQRSERVIGNVMRGLANDGSLKREQVVIATKGGYVAFDGEVPANPRSWFEENFLKPGILQPSDLVQGSHCMTPRYLEAMLDLSRSNLGLETIDIYYIHNPETQLSAVSREEFFARIRNAFEFLEGAVQAGKIRFYGAATWSGFRVQPNERGYLSLADLVKVASDVAGANHHFRVIQLPYNLAMTEALTLRNQTLPGGNQVSLLAAADTMGIAVCASASLLQGQLTQRLPDVLQTAFPAMESDAQRSIQFSRSTPGIGVTLIGMSSIAHVEQNLATLKHPPSPDALMKLFTRAD
ncbi:MAG TPA: aldo/keto reductase [Candidatus Binataceae bacterium]|nr:aldo/keto reductase [Candidatus Binataceae bacterium]